MEEGLQSRRWGVLAALVVISFCTQFAYIVPGGLAIKMFTYYNITPLLFSMVMSIPYFAGILFAVASGALADRFGVNKIINVTLVLMIIGSLWRTFTVSFVPLFAASFIMGFATAAINASTPKILRAWFPGRSNNFAMGATVCATSIGATVGIFVGSMPGVEVVPCWWASVVLVVIALAVWNLGYREHPESGSMVEGSFVGQIGSAFKTRGVLMISVIAFVFFGANIVTTTYGVAGLTTYAGESSAATVNIMMTSFSIMICISSLLLPSVVAKCSRMRPPVIVCLMLAGIPLVLQYVLPFGIATWVCIIVAALAYGPIFSCVKTLPYLLPDVKPEQLGAVGGIQSMFQCLGQFLVTSYIISPICAAIDPANGVLFYSSAYVAHLILFVVVAILFFTIPNVRASVADKIKDEEAGNA